MAAPPLRPPLAGRLVDALPVGLAVIAAPGTIAWANPAYFRTTGRDPGVLGRDYHEIAEEDGTWSTEVRDAVDAALTARTTSSFRAVRARYGHRPGGTWLDVDVLPLSESEGATPHALLLVRDVTERVEEEARARLFYQSFRSSTNPIQLTDAHGIMVDVNPAFERTYGYARAECIGRRPNLVRSPLTPAPLYETMWRELRDPDRGFWSGEIVNQDRQGREHPVLLSITAIRGPSGEITHYLGVTVDLSEQRSWELRAAHSEKLASVGQLAAGVAHEINTPLANVMLIAESLRRRSTDPSTLARLDRLAEQVELAASIVRSLLDFARRSEPRPQALDLVEVARESVGFLRGKQSADVEIDERYPAEEVPITGDRGQLMQVVTNLLNNAYDAMHGRGRVEVSVRRQGPWAEVEVLDSGPGIRPEALPHIFEPFYTTKPPGEGTGLGLAICEGIVRSHRGTISARNAPGASFLVALPLRAGPAPPGPAPEGERGTPRVVKRSLSDHQIPETG